MTDQYEQPEQTEPEFPTEVVPEWMDLENPIDLGFPVYFHDFAKRFPEEITRDRSIKWAVSTMQVLNEETGRIDKSPRHPKTGERLSVTEPDTWATLEECLDSKYPAWGMLLTPDDPYTVIDLDKTDSVDEKELLRKIIGTFTDTYMEKSISGNGAHIILKGSAQEGRRRGAVEVYSQERYIICTGKFTKVHELRDVVDGGVPLQNLIDSLLADDNPDLIKYSESQPETIDDNEVLSRIAKGKSTGGVDGSAWIVKAFGFKPKPDHDWSLMDSQLASQICFHTKNHDQAVRIFSTSGLWRGAGGDSVKSGYESPAKYVNDYLLRRTFAKCWGQHASRAASQKAANDETYEKLVSYVSNKDDKSASLDIIDNSTGEVLTEYDSFDVIRPNVKTNLYQGKFGSRTFDTFLPPIHKPTGLLGKIADYIMVSSSSPVPEVAISAAIAMVSGIAGRQYNINTSGLGLYVVLVGNSGIGKESASDGISSLFHAIAQQHPAVMLHLGPSTFASGQAVTTTMQEGEGKMPSKICRLSEFGHTLAAVTKHDASSSEATLRKALLEFHSKTGWGKYFSESAYASEQNKLPPIHSPNLSFLGDTTPEKFFESVTVDTIADGLAPRMLIIETDTLGSFRRNKRKSSSEIPHDLIADMMPLISSVSTLHSKNMVVNIEYEDGVWDHFSDYAEFCDMMAKDQTVTEAIWRRCHLHALRLAGTAAVGNNPLNPVVTMDDAKWAIYMLRRSMLSFMYRVENAQFGSTEAARQEIMVERIKRYYETFAESDDVAAIETDELRLSDRVSRDGYIKHAYLYRFLNKIKAFNQGDKAVQLINQTVRSLIQQGFIHEVDVKTTYEIGNRSKTLGTVYARGSEYDKF